MASTGPRPRGPTATPDGDLVPLKPLFSTYQQGENRVTASILAVLARLGLHLTERILGGMLGDANVSLVSFTPLPATSGPGNPDGEILARARFLFEVKIASGALDSAQAAALKIAYTDKLGDDHDGRLIILTPDVGCPKPLVGLGDERVVWVNFVTLAVVLREVVADDRDPASEHEAYLIRELLALFDAEGLLDNRDTVVMAARTAYGFYLSHAAYVCQPNRSIRPVRRMGFYTSRQIKPEVPQILGSRKAVLFDADNAATLTQATDEIDRSVGLIVAKCLADGTRNAGDLHDVYVLSPADDANTLRLPQPLAHTGSFAFTMGQRYISSTQLVDAVTTGDL